MSKRFTTFLVLAAAMLLAIPAQGQTIVKKSAAKQTAIQTMTPSAKEFKATKDAYLKANDKTVGVAFRSAAAVEAPVQKTAEDYQVLKANDTSVGKQFKSWNWAAHQAPQFKSTSGLVNTDNVRQPLYKFTGRELSLFNRFDGQAQVSRRAATTDEHGIITAPDEGETKYYTRTGTAFYVSNNSVYDEDQSGTVTIVEAEGGKVYIKDPVSHYAQAAWVEGTRDGNTITVAGAQPLAWNSNYSATLSLNWGNVETTQTGKTYVRGEGDITFTVDDEAGTITLDGSSADKIIAVFWDDDNSWSGYGDYGTVWTVDPNYQPASTDLIVLPDGAEVQQWYADGAGSTTVPTDVNVAFVGSDVYISGLCANFPEAWIKGTLEGTTVTFSKFQYVGAYGGTMPIWAVGADSQTGNLLDAFTMTYDSEAQTLTLDEGQFLVFNAAEDRMYYLSYIQSLTIYAEAPAPAVIDVLPYVNSFDDAALQKHFTIIDANEDGRTWNWYNGMARYTYSETNQGDDWLISPQIYLQAGKKYVFSIQAHAQSANYPERLEVKAALAPESLDEPVSAALMAAGTEVIASSDVTTAGFVPFTNDAFTVAETGFYYIGVHAISDADEYYLYVDDFALEAAPITAPYTADFSTADAMGDFTVLDANGDATNNGNGTWNWSASNGAYYKYHSSNAADDYLILPIQLEAGKNYNVTVNAACNGYPEKFEVVYGTAATKEALTNVIIAETALESTEFADYTGSFTAAEAGTYYVAIHATSDADMFNLKVMKFDIEVGADAAAPDAVTDLSVVATENKLEATVSFKAPTKTVGGDDLTDLTQIDILRDGAVIKSLTEGVTPGAELSYVDNDETLTVGTHVYQVIPYNTNGVGVKSEKVSVFLSAVIQVPYVVDFTKSGSLDVFNVIDANDDGKTWKWSASNGAFYTYDSENAADDYLVSMPIHFVAGKSYNLTVNAKGSSTYPERFEVKLGKAATVDGLDKVILPATVANAGEYVDYEGSFSVEEDGDYFVAIHAISDADMNTLCVAKLTIEKGAEPTAPAAVADFTVTAGAQGALEANVSFTAPTTFVNGAAATGTLNVDIYRDDVVVKTLENIAYGSEQNWKDETVENGKVYTYQVIPSNADGAGLKSDKISVFVGIDALGGVPGFTASNVTPSTITFTWNAAEGVHGGYINTAAIKYTIYSMHVEEVEIIPGWTMQELVADEAVATVTGGTTATIDYNTLQGEQKYQYFGISAAYDTDETDPAEAYTAVLVGAPYELPIAESFTDKTLHYNWESNGGLGIDTYSSDEDGVALKLYNNGNGSEVYFALPRVNLNAVENPTIIFDAFNGQNVDKVKVVGSADGADLTVLGEFNLSSDYTTIKQVLTSVKGTAFSTVGILATIPTASVSQYEDHVVIDNIRIVDLYEYNLKAEISAPKSVVAGKSAKVVATVTNEGDNAVQGYTVTVKAGEKVITSVIGSDELAPFAKDEIEVEYETSIFDEAGDVNLTVTVDYENELYPDDNTANTIITVKEPTAGAPASLTAVDKGAEGVELTWAMPAASRAADAVTEDFEDTDVFEPFSLGGITADEHNGAFGDWKLYDGNGITVYGFNGLQFPNNYQPAAWQVFTTVGDGAAFADNYPANSGDQYLISFCPAEENNAPAADHWLISPELSGAAQTISFFARIITAQYGPETFEVWASTTDDNVESFTKVADYSTEAVEWTEFTADLPAGAKYFAIRHTSVDIFGLLIDDVTFAAAGATAPVPTSFNIYFEKDKVASVEGDKTTYTVAVDKLTAGEHTFAVTAVYATGAESKPVTATVTVTTDIRQIAADGKAVDIYSVDGKLVRSQATSLDGLKGLYIVDGKKIMVK